MKAWAGKFVIHAGVFFILDYISKGAIFDDRWAIIWAALLLVVLNMIIKPVLKALSLPLTCITFGLFGFVVSALVIGIMDRMMVSVHFESFGQYLIAAVLIAAGDALFIQ